MSVVSTRGVISSRSALLRFKPIFASLSPDAFLMPLSPQGARLAQHAPDDRLVQLDEHLGYEHGDRATKTDAEGR